MLLIEDNLWYWVNHVFASGDEVRGERQIENAVRMVNENKEETCVFSVISGIYESLKYHSEWPIIASDVTEEHISSAGVRAMVYHIYSSGDGTFEDLVLDAILEAIYGLDDFKYSTWLLAKEAARVIEIKYFRSSQVGRRWYDITEGEASRTA